MVYLVCGRETAPSTGQRHIQGYVRFKKDKRATAVQTALGTPCFQTPAKGNEQQNRTYCVKEGDYVEFGVYEATAGAQGHRTDLDVIVDLVQGGKSMREIAKECPKGIIKFQSGIQSLINLVQEAPLAREIHTTVLVGTTGVGKTHRVVTQFPDCYSVNLKDKYPWDRYTNQSVLLIDEFDPSTTTIQEMNRLLDKWRCPLQARYANKEAFWTRVYICANLPPCDWYTRLFSETLVQSLMRRITEPMGRIYHVQSREEVFDLLWWNPAVPAPLQVDPSLLQSNQISTLTRPSTVSSDTPPLHELRTPPRSPSPPPLKRLRRGLASISASTAVVPSSQPPVDAPGAVSAGSATNPLMIDD